MRQLTTLAALIHAVSNWWMYVADYAGLMAHGTVYTLKFRNGIRISCRAGTTDRGTVNEIWFKAMYAPSEVGIDDHTVVMDIGAHIGAFALFASVNNPHGRVIAYEPDEENFRLLTKNIQESARTNITAHKKAMAGSVGMRTLYISNRDPDCHNLFVDESGEKEEVACTTLPAAMAEDKVADLDYLKIDCEGAEYELLFACDPALFAHVRQIAMEVHQKQPDHDPRRLEDLLRDQGFTVRRDHFMLYAHQT